MNAREKESIDREVSDYVRRRALPSPDAPAVGFDSAAEWIFRTVGARPDWSAVQIRYFLGEALRVHSDDVARAAIETGRTEERQTNPALRAFGAAVAHACEASGKRDRAIACEVFEQLTSTGGNAMYAFYQAIEAIGGKPPKT